MIVAFDLPVVEKDERKAYTNFRKFLLEDGYQMIQFRAILKLGVIARIIRFALPT